MVADRAARSGLTARSQRDLYRLPAVDAAMRKNRRLCVCVHVCVRMCVLHDGAAWHDGV